MLFLDIAGDTSIMINCGPQYQLCLPVNSNAFLLVGSICATTLVPDGASGVLLRLNSPIRKEYAENLGLLRELRNKFNVIFDCSIKLSHYTSETFGSHVTNPSLK